jgi:hypothetical protein
MSLFADAFQPHIPRGLFEVRGVVESTLDDLIGKKSSFYPTYKGSPAVWDLDFHDNDLVSTFLACECGRFGSAAFQTFLELEHHVLEPDRVPWVLIQAYYAAFYAGQSILRILGTTCTYIDRNRAATLLRVLKIYEPQAQFDGGLYVTEVPYNGSSMTFQSLGTDPGGTHEKFWTVFGKRLARLGNDVLTGPMAPMDAQTISARIGELLAVLSRDGARNRLSEARNAIQYRQSMGVWYSQYELTRNDLQVLARIACAWKDDPLSIKVESAGRGEIVPFLAACAFIVSLSLDLLRRIADRGKMGRARSFVCFGPLRFLESRQPQLAKKWKASGNAVGFGSRV